MNDALPERLRVIDSHTIGEPTRVVIDDDLVCRLDLGEGAVLDRRERFRNRYDHLRRAIVGDPRGADAMVGVIMLPPSEEDCLAGVIYFNRVGYLDMCGHATIGLAVTLGQSGRISPGRFRLETPAGIVGVAWHGGEDATFESVRPRRIRRGLGIDCDDGSHVTGELATSGLWFFLCRDHGLNLVAGELPRLLDRSRSIRRSLEARGVRGDRSEPIDHVVLLGPPQDPRNHGRAFVLCPDDGFDRSPCGTATSAIIGCLYEDGLLPAGEPFRQESILGGVYEATYRLADGICVPAVRGTAWIMAESELRFDPTDPYRCGLPV